MNNLDIADHCLISKRTVIYYRKAFQNIIKCIVIKEQKETKISSKDRAIQVDKTVFVKGRLISPPTNRR